MYRSLYFGIYDSIKPEYGKRGREEGGREEGAGRRMEGDKVLFLLGCILLVD